MYGYFDIGNQISLQSAGKTYRFMPKWLSEDNTHPFLCGKRFVHQFESLTAMCLELRPETVCLYRSYALGDILMLLPLARMFRRALAIEEPIRIVVENRFFEQLRRYTWGGELRFLRKRGTIDYGCDVHIDLNKVLEVDHYGGVASDTHRIDLYATVLGLGDL